MYRNPMPSPCPRCESPSVELLFQIPDRGKVWGLARCGACGQHYCEPPPTSAEIAGCYEGDYHGELREAGASERIFGPKFRDYREWVLKFVAPGKSLDIGTATGLFPSLLKEAGFDAEGIEFNEASAQWGSRHYGIKIMSGSLETSGVSPESYDLITMTDVLEHTDHPLRFLDFVRSYLKPGGFMLITFPDVCSIEARYTNFIAGVLRRDWIRHRACRIPAHIWEFTPQTASTMFVKAGFQVRGFRRRQDTIEPASGLLALLMLPTQLLKIPPIGHSMGSQMHFIIQKQG